MFIMAKPSDQLFVIKSDKLQEFLAIKPDKEADEEARKRVGNFQRVCRREPEVIPVGSNFNDYYSSLPPERRANIECQVARITKEIGNESQSTPNQEALTAMEEAENITASSYKNIGELTKAVEEE